MKKIIIHTILVLFFGIVGFAQDDSEEDVVSDAGFTQEELQKEQKALDFEKLFIESLQQKSIENYNKALESLVACEAIYPNNIAMLFEMAKNNFALKNYMDAIHYCDKALSVDTDNFWILKLLKEIYVKQHDYPTAIEIQKKLYSQKKSEAHALLRLYYYTKAYNKGKSILIDVEEKNIYVPAKQFYVDFFNETPKANKKPTESSTNKDISELKKEYSENRSFTSLKNLLEREYQLKKYNNLFDDSTNGLELFPSQSIVYLYKGVALNGLNKYREAIGVLETGLDLIFDKPALKKRFYKALIVSYTATQNTVRVNHYKVMVQKLQL